MSNLAFKSLFVAALAATAFLPATASEARNFPARSGSSAFHEDAGCWSPMGGSVTNVCNAPKHWYLPVIFDGTNFGYLQAWVVVEATWLSNNVSCRMTGSNWNNTAFSFSDNSNLTALVPVTGTSYARFYQTWIPSDSSGMASVDCLVNPGGRIHMAAL
jgi:hypothetical protein